MMKTYTLIFLLATTAFLTVGCGCGKGDSGGDGVKSEVSNQMSSANEIAKRVDGKWDKLTDAEKQKLITQFGTKETAQDMLKNMAHPPNEKYKPKAQ